MLRCRGSAACTLSVTRTVVVPVALVECHDLALHNLFRQLPHISPLELLAEAVSGAGRTPHGILSRRHTSTLTPVMTAALPVQVLSYHVIPAAALNSKQVQSQAYMHTLQGARVTIKKRSSGSVRITGGTPGNRANVIVPNIRAGNSIIHVIDAVLLPPS